MFCTLEDAWGSHSNNTLSKDDNNIPESIFKESNKIEGFENNEYNINKKENSNDDMYKQYIQLKEMFDNNSNNNISQVCLAVENHCKSCSYCRNKNVSKPSVFNFSDIKIPEINISNLVKSNTDIISIILVILLIYLLVKLLFK